MLDLTKEHLAPKGYTHDRLKKEFNVEDLNELIKDVPYSYEVLS